VQDSILEEIQASNHQAKAAADWLTQAVCPDASAFYQHIREYALARYLLRASDVSSEDSLVELAKASLARVLNVPHDMLERADVPGGCTGATAVSDKKVLLILSLSKLLQIPITADTAVEFRTLQDVSMYFYRQKWGNQP